MATFQKRDHVLSDSPYGNGTLILTERSGHSCNVKEGWKETCPASSPSVPLQYAGIELTVAQATYEKNKPRW